MEEIIKLWKENKVDYVNFQFSCGGDSMNDTSIQIYDEAGTEISCSELSDFFEDAVYKRVEFYENSDGHYQGEAGNVEIRLDDDGEDFDYYKSSQSEWSESYDNDIEVELTDKQIEFIKNKILNINGDDGNVTTNYKMDCILSDEEEKMVEVIEEKINVEAQEFQPTTDNEVSEWYRFTTNEQGEEIRIIDNKIIVTVTNSVTEYRDED